jgi:succinate dehydrogenase/fumarate reductase flavoprotein subunit
LKNKAMSIKEEFKTVEVTTDLLILGGGMSACGAAFEAAHWAKKNNLKVTVVDKAAMDRSGAVAMGLSAINLYLGLKDNENTIEDYIKYVKTDLMGITRDDLVANIARHVDGSVHLFEKWGLPLWKDEEGNYVREGRWQVMINGESYKTIVAEAAKMPSPKWRNMESTTKGFLLPILLWMEIELPELLVLALGKRKFIFLRPRLLFLLWAEPCMSLNHGM